MTSSRRGFFGFLAGAFAAPYVRVTPDPSVPMKVIYEQFIPKEMFVTRATLAYAWTDTRGRFPE